MFTSRAEFRLSLREDNADARLTAIGRRLGCVDDARWNAFSAKQDVVSRETTRLQSTWVSPKNLPTTEMQRVVGQPIEREYRLLDLLRRPDVEYRSLMSLRNLAGELISSNTSLTEAEATQVEINVKYAGYVDRQRDEVQRVSGQDDLVLRRRHRLQRRPRPLLRSPSEAPHPAPADTRRGVEDRRRDAGDDLAAARSSQARPRSTPCGRGRRGVTRVAESGLKDRLEEGLSRLRLAATAAPDRPTVGLTWRCSTNGTVSTT